MEDKSRRRPECSPRNYWHDCSNFLQVFPSVQRHDCLKYFLLINFSGPYCNIDMLATTQLRRVNITASSQVSNLVSRASAASALDYCLHEIYDHKHVLHMLNEIH